ncbi:Extracellular metalloprotease [Seminavis robusta]|uniref:Extracellular metalloprotease n=1 Tax=Seminavis robusta TaxID=568900 RepID=A0A9N8H6Z0_9STRA|nr:Extracellular metalloprotease [Seminavis robusta]|eukprot:Sro125_g060400.1 Extracellular metalloprotease (713) ;mRNA; r:108591-110846
MTFKHKNPFLLVCSFLLVNGNEALPQPPQQELCGTRDLTAFERQLDLQRMTALFGSPSDHQGRKLALPPCEELCKQCIEIDTYFHLSGYPLDNQNESSAWVIPHPSDEFRMLRQELRNKTINNEDIDISSPGRFSTVHDIYQLIQDTVNVINTRYADSPFKFNWMNSDPANSTVHVRNSFAFVYAGNVYKSNDYATQAHQGDRRTLNVYLNYRICGHMFIWQETNCLTIGAATNPSYQLDRTSDGIYLAYDTLTGGGLENYDTGISLVHEIGHWLGLLHVFESETLPDEEDSNDESDPCDPINVDHGDFVDDTPFLPRPSIMMYPCSSTFYEQPGEEIPNSCPKLPGVDPVFNYMNYVGPESCLAQGHGEFTCGQNLRMMRQWLLYRDHTDICVQGEMEVNVTMKFDSDFLSVHAELAPFNSNNNEPIFNLERDIDMSLLREQGVGNDTRIMNFCVPRDEYVLVVTDAGRDGFADGFIDVAVDGKQIHRVQGDFGATECIKFGPDGVKTESRNAAVSNDKVFGESYHYVVSGQETGITCSASSEQYLEEPVPIVKNLYMRVAVSISNVTEGVCINDVTKLDIAIDGSVTNVYPRDDNDLYRFDSSVVKCRGETCVVEFDRERLEGIYNPRNPNGIYNTTCKATVLLGYGAACDDFLSDGKFDCSDSPEVFTAGEGHVAFSLPVSASRSSFQIACSFFIIAFTSAWAWMQLSL